MRLEKVNQLKDFASKQEDLDAQPQDKDVKKVKGTQPKKYYKTLDKDTKRKERFFKKKAGTYKKSDDDDDYKLVMNEGQKQNHLRLLRSLRRCMVIVMDIQRCTCSWWTKT